MVQCLRCIMTSEQITKKCNGLAQRSRPSSQPIAVFPLKLDLWRPQEDSRTSGPAARAGLDSSGQKLSWVNVNSKLTTSASLMVPNRTCPLPPQPHRRGSLETDDNGQHAR